MSDKTEFVEIECTHCHNSFKRTLHRHKDAIKHGYRPYCSKKCKSAGKNTSIKCKCANCHGQVLVQNSIYTKSESKNFFCSNSCSATFNNKKRNGMAEKTKEKIRRGVIKSLSSQGKSIRCDKEYICPICNITFTSSRKYQTCCGKTCGQIYQFGSIAYTKEDIVNGIMNKFAETGYTPQKRGCKRRLSSAATRLFGTWNKAMKECGLKPNPSKYQKVRLKCKDGHMSDSISEMLVDNWFYSKNIQHERSRKYQGTNMDCDFYLTDYDIWVEYFGLINESDEYDKTVKAKKDFADENGITLMGVTPIYLYPEIKLNELFEGILEI